MTELSTPGQRTAKQLHTYTPYSSISHNPSRTPRFTKTPISRRFVASSRRQSQAGSEAKDYDYQGLLKKTWKVFSLSPLYKFKPSKPSLTKYARSLDVALSQVKVQGFQTDSSGCEKSSFSVYEGLNFGTNDAQAVQVQIIEKPDAERGAKIVLNALLICVDLDCSPIPEHLSSHFTYYPVILVSGNKSYTDTLLTWLERHFDCKSSSIQFSDNDLRWMLVTWISQDIPKKAFPVLMQYSLSDICQGISTIDCKYEAGFCKELWERLNGTISSREALNEFEVNQFVDALENHMEYTMHIVFSKMSLSEVGTSVAYVSSQGKLKLFSSAGVFPALHLICEIVKDRYMDIRYALT